MMRSLIHNGGVVVLALVLSSCSTRGLFTLLDSERRELARQARQMEQGGFQEKPMDWRQAKNRMLESGLGFVRARAQIEEIRRKRKNQWREWLPRPSLYVSVQSRIEELGDLNSDDLSTSLYAPLAIPNPVSVQSRAYQYALGEMQARDNLEVMKRQEVIVLYGLFKAWEDLQNEEMAARDLETADAKDLLERVFSDMESKESLSERKAMIQLRLSRMLNLPDVRVVPVLRGLPEPDYADELDALRPGENYGNLAVKLSSYQIVSAVLRSRGVKLDQWRPPSASVGVPAIYDSNRTGTPWLDSADQVSLFSSWSKSFDVTGRTAASIENAEQYVVFVRENLKLRVAQDHHEWEKLKKRYGMLLKKRQFMRARLQRMLDETGGDALGSIALIRSVAQELRSIEKSKMGLDIEVWKWDDAAWK